METQNAPDEITFGHLAQGIRNLYHAFLMRVYELLRFIYKNWIVFLILILLGFGIGYLMDTQKPAAKNARLIVQLNYSSTPVIYEAIEHLNAKLKGHDYDFLKAHHLYKKGHSLIKEVEITPVVDLSQALQQFRKDSKQGDLVRYLLKQAGKENPEILTSDLFLSQYKLHKIEIKGSRQADPSTLQGILDYLNNNKGLQKAKAVYQKSLAFKIHEHKLNIAQIDSIFKRLGERNTLGSIGNNNPVSLYESGQSILDLSKIIREKRTLMEDLEELQADAVNYDNPVAVLNTPDWTRDVKSFFERILWLPITLVAAYMVLAFAISGIKKGKRLTEQQNKK